MQGAGPRLHTEQDFLIAVATAPSPVERISTAKEPATGKGSPKAKVLALGTCALVNRTWYHEAFVIS